MEIDLIKSAANGDHASYEKLVGKYKSLVFNVIYSISGNTPEADDIAQEVFIKAYYSLGSFNGSAKFSTWLYRITINKSLDLLRKKNKKVISLDAAQDDSTFLNALINSSDNIEAKLIKQEARAAVQKMILKLAPRHRAIITLKDIEGLSYKEIAQIMNISLDSVKVTLYRARQSLKEMVLSLNNRKNSPPAAKFSVKEAVKNEV